MRYSNGIEQTSWSSVLYVVGVWTGFVSVIAKYVIR